MKFILLSTLCLMWILPLHLIAENKDVVTKWKTDEFEVNEVLTKSYAGFVQANWKLVGAGITIKHALFIRNSNDLFGYNYKHLKEDLDMDYVITQNDVIHKTFHENQSYLAGYILDLGEDFFPFAAAGVIIDRKVWEIHEGDNPVFEDGVYTIKGKYKSTATGIIGAFYMIGIGFFLEGNLQVYPVMPYLGIGYMIPIERSYSITIEK